MVAMVCNPRTATTGLAASLFTLFVAWTCQADDWLTYRHDPTRSGVSTDAIDVQDLGKKWTWKSDAAPASAWSGPAKWDAYAGIRGLRSMRNYDPAFALIATDTRVFFGSSADDSVRCLDLATGKVLWTFTSGGAVRIAPCFSYGKLYFGSDDGHAYCLDAETGALVWKRDPLSLLVDREGKDGIAERWIINNQRAIPYWPIRSGVSVVDGTAYFAASMLPWRESYLCAVDAVEGQLKTPSHYAKRVSGQTMEGAIAVSPGQLVVPQGRVAPVLFDRKTGKNLGALKGGGGCFVVVSPEGSVFHGPGNKTGWITSSNGSSRETIATYAGGNVLCIDGENSFLLTDTTLAATNFRERKKLWDIPSDAPHTMILGSNVVVCGGMDRVVIYDRKDGKELWRATVNGHVHELAIVTGDLLVSTDTGEVSCFGTGGSNEAPVEAASPPGKAPDATVVPVTTPGIISQWHFHEGLVKDDSLPDLAGTNTVKLPTGSHFETLGTHQALSLLEAPGTITVRERYQDAGIPTSAITAEAWVRIDQPLRWGGIVGAIQDNGDYERGWILGYIDDRFSFAVASEKEPTVMTYLTATRPFEKGRWYHVAGTYDGKVMKIYVDGEQRGEDTRQEGLISYPPKTSLNIGGYRDENENYPMQGMLHEIRIYGNALEAPAIKKHASSRILKSPVLATLPFGPYLQFLDSGSAIIRWEMKGGMDSMLVLKDGPGRTNFEGTTVNGMQEVVISGLKRNRQYQYRVEITETGEHTHTEWYDCDTFFNYAPDQPRDSSRRFGEEERQRSEQINSHLASPGGICVVMGLEDGTLAAQLAFATGMRVIAFDERQEVVDSIRNGLIGRGLYGTRVAIHRVDSLNRLPLTSMVANVVFSERQLAGLESSFPWSEAYRITQPNGGVLFGRPEPTNLKETFNSFSLEINSEEIAGSNLLFGRRGELPGAGEWSHLYGRPDNSAFGGETLQGVKRREDLQVQWIGRPGARYQPDRNGRKPAPLSIGGRLYLQGLQRIIALNAYNGSILWSLEIPSLGRFNMPRDCSNWCADKDHVYLAIDQECWMLDGKTGALVHRFKVPAGENDQHDFNWGYIASTDDLILGSAVKADAPFRNFWGGANDGWYDAREGDATGKVCSDRFFAFDKKTGKVQWSYAGGLLVNPTLTASRDRVFFVETRNAELIESGDRRVSDQRLWQDQYLVALDRRTGKKLWEYSLATEPGSVVFYLAHSGNRLSLVASSNKQYHVYVFDSDAGEANWENHFPWPSDNHGGHMSRPAIVGKTLYVRPRAYDLLTGQVLDKTVPMGGCGTYAATSDALFFRSGNVTVWDRESGKTTAWNRLRPDCWLSTIPAGGMLLSPEGGGGCSCGSWMETSIGFMPRAMIDK